MTRNSYGVECTMANPCIPCSSGTGHPPVLAVYDLDKGDYVPAAANYCTARWKSDGDDHAVGAICGRLGEHQVVDLWLCEHHWRRLFIWYDEQQRIEAERERELHASIRRRREAEMSSFDAQGSQIVYYVRRGDGAIKIGTTTQPANRMMALKQQHGPIEILLTHCGDGERERQMHRRFSDLRVEGEWFRPEMELLMWIANVRRKQVNVRTRMDGTVGLSVIVAMIKALKASQAQAA